MRALLVATVLATPASAYALNQNVHEQISHDGCVAVGLPDEFCERVGTEAYNVDAYEWRDPSAHAQIPNTGNTCAAVNASLGRLQALGSDIRTSLARLAGAPSQAVATHIAMQLGRALHTIQDDCAHHGMPNAQHAWASRVDTCSGSS